MANIYKISQIRTSYTKAASDLISAMKKHRWGFEELIRYYLKVRENNAHVLEMLPPYVVAALRALSPLQLVKQCDAVVHPKNDAGIENDFVSKKFFEMTAAWDKCLVVNPNPSFFVAYKKYAERLLITYTSDLMVQLLGSEPTLKKFRFCRMGDITIQDGINRALVFASQETSENCEQILRHLKEVMVDGAGSNIYLYFPNVFWDSKKNSFAEEIFAHFTVHSFALIDAKAVSIAPKKKTLFILRNAIERNASCIAQEARLVIAKRKRYLELSPEVAVEYREMIERRKTLVSVYTHATKGAKEETRVRQPARVYEFSLEIAIHVTFFAYHDDGSCRGAYGFRDWPTDKQKRRNISQYGKLFASPSHGRRLPSEEDAFQYAEKMLFSNQKFGNLVRAKTIDRFKKKPLTIKTMWFLCLELLEKNADYSHNICVDFFSTLREKSHELWELTVTAENAEKIIEAASEYAKHHEFSYGNQKKLYEQLALIADFGRNAQHTSVNPFRDLLIEKVDRKNKEQQKRDALMMSSRDLASIGRLVNVVLSDHMQIMLAIGFLIKLFTAMSTGEVCALRWADFRKVTNLDLYQFIVTKYFAGKETQARAFTNDEQYRAIPSINRLTKILKDFKSKTIERLKIDGKDGVDIETCPILHCADDPTVPINAEVLNKYVKGVLATVAPDSHILTTMTEDGTELVTDTSKYRGDLLRANWEYHAVHTMGMTLDEIAYVKGTKPHTVAARNYLDFRCARSQLVLSSKMERWATLCFGEEECPGVLSRSGKCTGVTEISVESLPFLCELFLDLKILPEGVSLKIMARRGAVVVVDQIRGGRP